MIRCLHLQANIFNPTSLRTLKGVPPVKAATPAPDQPWLAVYRFCYLTFGNIDLIYDKPKSLRDLAPDKIT
jgi:hypothetical protein